jgi:hypothetical protein
MLHAVDVTALHINQNSIYDVLESGSGLKSWGTRTSASLSNENCIPYSHEEYMFLF